MPKRPCAQSSPDFSASSDPPYVAPSLDRRLANSLSPDAPPNGTDDSSLADASVWRSEISVARRDVAMALLNWSSVAKVTLTAAEATLAAAKATHAAAEAAIYAADITLQAARAAKALARRHIPEADDRLDNSRRSFNSLVSPVLFFCRLPV